LLRRELLPCRRGGAATAAAAAAAALEPSGGGGGAAAAASAAPWWTQGQSALAIPGLIAANQSGRFLEILYGAGQVATAIGFNLARSFLGLPPLPLELGLVSRHHGLH
jgi:hypothetical protein